MDFDRLNEFDEVITYLFTSQYSGDYIVLGGVHWVNAPINFDMLCSIQSAALGSITFERNATPFATNMAQRTSKIVHLTRGDTLGLYVRQASGAPVAINSGLNFTHMSINRLR